MNLGMYGILVVFAAFILLLFLNPNLSCFGKKIRSPLHPLLGRKNKAAKKIVTEDYGFKLVEDDERDLSRGSAFESASNKSEKDVPPTQKKPLKTEDYGFNLDE